MSNFIIESDILYNMSDIGNISVVYLNQDSELSDKVLHLKGPAAAVFNAITEKKCLDDLVELLKLKTNKNENDCKAFLNKFITDLEKLKILKVTK